MKTQYSILIIGGGNAGISVASQLLLKNPKLEIGLIEPSKKHYYQPAWTLVGGGDFDLNKTVRSEKSVIPKEVDWIQDAAQTFLPNENAVITTSGKKYRYDYLVVCPGIQLNWDQIKGLKENLGKNGVTSNYTFETAPYTFECLKKIKPGDNAIFTNPGTPVKCGGAPQKIMYLASDFWRKKKILNKINVDFTTAGGVIFGIKKYADSLNKMVKKYGIKLSFKHDLIEIDGENKKAFFKVTYPDGTTEIISKQFDMIHVTPPQSAPNFIKESPLAND